jgi:hypothetical protein
MLYNKNIILFILLSLVMTMSCDDCVFVSRNITSVAIRFYRKNPSKTIRKPIRYVFDSIQTATRGLIQKDSISNAPLNLTVNLPLHPFEDESKFYILSKVRQGSILVQKKDSIVFSYQRNFAVVSPRCGYDQRIDNLRIKTSSFDSVVIFKGSLEVNDTVNVRIYVQ